MASTDLSKLKVSLTKHNAHKIATLLRKYKADDVPHHLDEVHAERAQTYKNLSMQPGDRVPDVWERVKAFGDEAIDGLVLIGIIFSHHALIDAMKNASARAMCAGRIDRGNQLDGKAYTNFARVVDQLGYATELTKSGFAFNLQNLLATAGLGPLVRDLLARKLQAAGWRQTNTIVDEASSLGLQRVFGISAPEFKAWLSKGLTPASIEPAILVKDQEFFQAVIEGRSYGPFEFKPGHMDRATAALSRKPSPRTKATRLHNEIQNELYAYLRDELGEENVGTEVATGCGTSVDLATRSSGSVTFYEIKTSPSVRTNIRQAIPQLLEYAFWPGAKRANKLVIVSHLALTKDAEQYLAHLRKRFKVPITYQQFSLKRKKLLSSR